MIGYRDMTFCLFWKECKHGDKCPRALTEEVEEQAAMWWGSQDAPIAQYTDKPECYEVI